MKNIMNFTAAFLAVFLLTSARAAEDLSQTLQIGLLEEEAHQNLPAAIEAYQKVLKLHENQRQLAATALFRLGECHRKLSQTNDAVAQYERLLREYPDQTVLVNLSRQNLAGLGASIEADAIPPMSQRARAEQIRLLEEELALVDTELATATRMVDNGVQPVLSLIPIQRRRLGLQRQLAMLQDASRATVVSTDEEQQEVQRIQTLIRDSPDLINAKDKTFKTPLHYAVEKGQLIVVRFLLDNGAQVNTTSHRQETPLHQATMYGHNAMAKLLLARGADVAAKDAYGRTALHHAADKGYQTLCETLMEAGAQVNGTDNHNSTSLHLAVSAGWVDVTEWLLEHGADPELHSQSWFPASAKIEDPPPLAGTPLYFGIGHPQVTALLLKWKVNPNPMNEFGHAPLHYAAAYNHRETMRLLIQNGAEVDVEVNRVGDPKHGYTPLHYALANRRTDAARFLLEKGADPNRPMNHWQARECAGGSPLIIAVGMNHEEMVKALLQYKADPNVVNECGTSPLISATPRGNAVLLDALLQHGADPNLDVRSHFTPLHDTAHRVFLEGTQLLLAKKANPNVQDDLRNQTPMHYLIQSALKSASQSPPPGIPTRATAARALRNTGQASSPSPTETISSIHSDAIKSAQLLIDHGIDLNVRDWNGLTALNLMGIPAQPGDPGLRALADLLREHGALDALPELSPNPDVIRIWRKGEVQGRVVYQRGNQWANRFTLMEVLLDTYGGVFREGGQHRVPRGPGAIPQVAGFPLRNWPEGYDFPDLSALQIHRLKPNGSYAYIDVDFLDRTTPHGINCAKDVELRFGDVLIIPESPHALSDKPTGLKKDRFDRMEACQRGEVTLSTAGQSIKLELGSGLSRYLPNVLERQEAKEVLRSTSDLAHVKVLRVVNDEAKVFLIDATRPAPMADSLLLEYGDVIEVPEK